MRFVIVGMGSMGKRRARLLDGMGHTVLGVDNAPERVDEVMEMGMSCYESLPAALAARPCDGAFVCAAPLGHAKVIDALLDAQLPVFTELNLVADGYRELMAKAKAKGLPLFLSSTMLYRAEIEAIMRRVAAFKKPLNYIYHIGQYLPSWHPWEGYQNFFVGDARSSGVREILGIELPWLLSAFGAAKPVAVQSDKLSGLDIPYDDSWFITLRHAGGAKGVLAADVVCPRAVRYLEVFGEGLHLFWEGKPGTLFEADAGGEKHPIHSYDDYEHNPGYSENIVEDAYRAEIADFIAVLGGGGAPRWSFAQDLSAIALMDAIEQLGGGAGQ